MSGRCTHEILTGVCWQRSYTCHHLPFDCRVVSVRTTATATRSVGRNIHSTRVRVRRHCRQHYYHIGNLPQRHLRYILGTSPAEVVDVPAARRHLWGRSPARARHRVVGQKPQRCPQRQRRRGFTGLTACYY